MLRPRRRRKKCIHPRRRALRRAAPALLLLLSAVAILGYAHHARSSRAHAYRMALHNAIQDRDWRTADICLQALIDLDPTPDLRLQLAELRARQGRSHEADEFLLALSEDGGAGHPAAHRLRARRLIDDSARTGDRQSLLRALRHLDRAGGPDAHVHALRANALFALGRRPEAVDALRRAEGAPPEILLPALFRWHLLSGGSDDPLRRAARAAATGFVPRATDALREREDPVLRRHLAQALTLLDRQPDAEAVLQVGIDRHPDDPFFPRTLAAFCMRRAHELGPASTLAADHVRRAIDLDPTRLGPLLTSPFARLAEAHFRRTRDAPVILARALLTAGRADEARALLEQLRRTRGASPIVDELLARALLTSPTPDPDTALTLTRSALPAHPTPPQVHDTRGRALLALGRHEEAVAALRKALPHLIGPAREANLANLTRARQALASPHPQR